MAMLRLQEYEHSTVDTEGAMGLAAILAGQLPELKGKRYLQPISYSITNTYSVFKPVCVCDVT